MQEFGGLRTPLGLARRHGPLPAGHHLGREQALQGRPVANGEGAHDHLIGRTGAVQELVEIEGRIAGLERGQAAELDIRRRLLGRFEPLGDRRAARNLFGRRVRLAADPPAEHRIEVIEHHRGQHGEDEEL